MRKKVKTLIDEVKIPGNKNEKAIGYLREHAIDAYEKGDIAKLKHMSYLALENIDVNEIQFEDIVWAMFWGINWAIDDNEFGIVLRKFESFLERHCKNYDRHGNREKLYNEFLENSKTSPRKGAFFYRSLAICLIKVIRFDFEKIDEWLNKILDMHFDDYPSRLEKEDFIFLSFIIEMCWHIRTEDEIWRKIADKWVNAFQSIDPSRRICTELRTMKEKIETFQWMFHRDYVNARNLEDLEIFSNQFLKEFHAAFEAFIKFDRKGCYKKLKSLGTRTRFGDENFTLVQGFINIARFHMVMFLHGEIEEIKREIKRTEDKKNESDSKLISFWTKLIDGLKKNLQEKEKELGDWEKGETAGILRFRRFMQENKYRLFLEQREASLDRSLYNAERKRSASTERLHYMRLIMQMELSAIKDFNFWNYRSVLENARDFALHIGLFGESDDIDDSIEKFLYNALELTIKSFVFKKEELLKKAEARLELGQNRRAYFEKLVNLIMITHPIQHNPAIKMLRIVSDSIPEDKDIPLNLAIWTRKYLNNKNMRLDIDLSYPDFWRDIIEYMPISEPAWNHLAPIIEQYFHWDSLFASQFDLLYKALLNAPMEYSVGWLRVIEEQVTSKKFKNEPLLSIVYNASVGNHELAPIAIGILEKYIESYPYDREYEFSLNMLYSNFDWKVLYQKYRDFMNEFREESVDELLVYCDRIHEEFIERQASGEKSRTMGFGGSIFGKFGHLNWNDFGQKKEERVINALKTAFESEPNENQADQLFRAIMHMLCNGSGSNFLHSALIELLVPYWKNPPRFWGPRSSIEKSPFSTFTMETNITDVVRYDLMVLGSGSYPIVEPMARQIIRIYALQYGLECEAYAPHVATIFFYGILLDKDSEIISQNSLCHLITQTLKQHNYQAGIAESIYRLLKNKIHSREQSGMELLKEGRQSQETADLLFAWFKKIHWSPHPDLRKNIALLVKLFMDGGYEDERLYSIRDTLKEDARARVRRVFQY